MYFPPVLYVHIKYPPWAVAFDGFKWVLHESVHSVYAHTIFHKTPKWEIKYIGVALCGLNAVCVYSLRHCRVQWADTHHYPALIYLSGYKYIRRATDAVLPVCVCVCNNKHICTTYVRVYAAAAYILATIPYNVHNKCMWIFPGKRARTAWKRYSRAKIHYHPFVGYIIRIARYDSAIWWHWCWISSVCASCEYE